MNKKNIENDIKIQAIKNIESDFRKVIDYYKNDNLDDDYYLDLFSYIYNREYYNDESLSSFELDYYMRLSEMLEKEIKYLI